MDANRYVNPAFRFDEADHDELMAAAATVDAVLKGEKGEDVRIVTFTDEPLTGYLLPGLLQTICCLLAYSACLQRLRLDCQFVERTRLRQSFADACLRAIIRR